MNTETRQTIHFGINFVFSPIPSMDRQSNLRFQQALLAAGLDFSQNQIHERELMVLREGSPRLEAKVALLPSAPLAQLLIVSPDSRTDLNLFVKDVQAVLDAFNATWQAPNRQLVSSDVTLRDLYEATGEHAFKELWETRLGQAPDSLSRLGHPVIGGGLRFVMPAQANEPNSAQVEVKIESFLQNPKKIFVETQFTWATPSSPGAPFEAERRLKEVDRYVEDQVEAFIVGGK
ncbi:MAG: hypothetical protein M1570_11915 [Chloroflexi bacterium]|nr:hypothetical protein [Chloroflexota bacterium]